MKRLAGLMAGMLLACGLWAQALVDSHFDLSQLPPDERQAILSELGLDDEGDPQASVPSLPEAPAFQVPDTSFPLGWLPARTRRLVNDYAGLLTPQQEAHLESRLLACNDTTSVQILLLITPDLGGDEIANFTQRLWEQWGVGQKESNNGVVLVVKPKNSTPGEVRIQTGYGMEGALPDAFCRRIIDDQLIPHFRNNEYFEGIDAALDVIIPVCAGEYSYADVQREDRAFTLISSLFLIIVIIIVVLYLSKHSSGTPGSGMGGTGSSGRGFYYGGFGSTGGGFGGGGSFGGGFGGFGGGSSGGGGASGRW